VARVLIVGGGCRGRALASELVGEGHTVRITTRSEERREAIEATGAECWIGTPDRLATLRGSLENVTVACWLLASAAGDPEQVRALHSTRLEFFLTQAIDTTVRGFLYEASGTVLEPEILAEGERIVRYLTARNEIPFRCLTAVLAEPDAWLRSAHQEIRSLLGSR
jgi:NAD(P)-dependent dehydrogenase (short-subunit alcohol dehydrogenase family)